MSGQIYWEKMEKKKKAELMMIERHLKNDIKITKSLAEWAKLFEGELGIPAQTIIYRVLNLKWDAERAFTTPKKEINYNPNRNPRLEKKEVQSPMVQKTFYKHKKKTVRQSKFMMIKWRGRTQSLYDWSVELAPVLGISPDSIERRVLRKWDIDKAFSI